MKSYMASPSTIERKWYVVDATGHTLGRLATEVANVLRGKNKPTYTPHIDTGDYVLAESGGVTRGICEVDEKGYLLSVTDRVGVERISGNPMYPNELHK